MLRLDWSCSGAGPRSHYGALGGGEVDGVDSGGQGLLQVVEDVGADAGTGRGALSGRGLIQKLLEGVEFNQQHHVLQEVALDESRKLRGTKKLCRESRKAQIFFSINTKVNYLGTFHFLRCKFSGFIGDSFFFSSIVKRHIFSTSLIFQIF